MFYRDVMLRKIDQLLYDDPVWHKIFLQAKQLEKLNNLFRSVISAELRPHCVLSKIESEQMVIIVYNANWATKLHYAIPDLLKDLRTQSEFKHVAKIRYTIAKPNQAFEKVEARLKKQDKFSLPKKKAILLTKIVRDIKNERLRETMLHLIGKRANLV